MCLVPSEMAWRAKVGQMDAMPELHLMDCIECGSCAYVCPANVPLVHYFRYAKMVIQADRRAQKKLDLDKSRIKAKAARVEQEKAEKERQKEAMKAAMIARKKAAEADAGAVVAPTEPSAGPAGGSEPSATTGGEAESKAARAARAAQAAKAARAAKAAAKE